MLLRCPLLERPGQFLSVSSEEFCRCTNYCSLAMISGKRRLGIDESSLCERSLIWLAESSRKPTKFIYLYIYIYKHLRSCPPPSHVFSRSCRMLVPSRCAIIRKKNSPYEMRLRLRLR
jgi:hypothetical protein